MATTWTIKPLRTALTCLMDSSRSHSVLRRLPDYSRRFQNKFDGQTLPFVCSIRLLSITASCLKSSEPDVSPSVTDMNKNDQMTDEGTQRRRPERIRQPRSRTPWLGKGSTQSTTNTFSSFSWMFAETGRKLLIWEGYKRNHKGAIPPAVSCIYMCFVRLYQLDCMFHGQI